MDEQKQDQEMLGSDQEIDNNRDELYLVPIYFY